MQSLEGGVRGYETNSVRGWQGFGAKFRPEFRFGCRVSG